MASGFSISGVMCKSGFYKKEGLLRKLTRDVGDWNRHGDGKAQGEHGDHGELHVGSLRY